ncbi:hypothetical protein [Halorussus salinus]|uniref:hypothetical protein n=1 Tax=Halorussus salinus TaxID=1364935 RepID=UPI001091976A|nr:hypothetical protein [Halorussus salinus]
MEDPSRSNRRTVLKSFGVGATTIAGLRSATGLGSAYYSSIGERWEKGDTYHADNCPYPPDITANAPVDSSIQVVAEKTDNDFEETPGDDIRIHEFDIEILLTSSYQLWQDKQAQQISEVSVTLSGEGGADLQAWQDGNTDTVLSGPARDESQIDETAEQITDSSDYGDTLLGLSEFALGKTTVYGGALISLASLAYSILDLGTEDDGKTYRWDYTVPTVSHLDPNEPEYDETDQTYAATIYLTDIRLGIPTDLETGTLHLETGIDGYGLSSTLTHDIVVGNDPGSGGL